MTLGFLCVVSVPLIVVYSTHPLLMFILGFGGDQFWMDKATIHQANLEDANGEFTFVDPDASRRMSEEDRLRQTSKYRVLNQAGVGLFDYYLENSQELWVLFIDRYVHRVNTLS